MEKIGKLSLPATILIAAIILGAFYYASEVGKQKSIERQQQVKIQEDRRIEQKAEDQKNSEAFQKSLCVTQAQKSATELYKDYCSKNSFCTYKEGVYLMPQYESAYNTCLESNGLK